MQATASSERDKKLEAQAGRDSRKVQFLLACIFVKSVVIIKGKPVWNYMYIASFDSIVLNQKFFRKA